MSAQDGGPAFPCMPPQDTSAGAAVGYPYPDAGMTLRDYFAAKALPIAWDAYDKGYCGTDDASDRNVDLVAASAYQFADAMLKARAK